MKSETYKLLTSRECALLLLLVATSTCGQDRVLHESIVEGEQFAHRIQLPANFRNSNLGNTRIPFDHYAFRASPSSPNLLFLTACKFDVPGDSKSRLEEELCSPDSFAIDTAHSYAARTTSPGEWEKTLPISGFFDMNDPYRRRLNDKRPIGQTPEPIGPNVRNIEYEGVRYRGRDYMRRGTWVSVQSFGDSDDGGILALGGADKRKLPDPNTVFLGNPIMNGAFGTFTVDIFDTNTGNRLAAVDADCKMSVHTCLRRANVANSRWFIIALDGSLQKILLFDFKPAGASAQ